MSEDMMQIGVINPYALAEVKAGHAIEWDRVADPKALLEQLLGQPYEQLFDPKYNSPLYTGLVYDEAKRAMVRHEGDEVFTSRSMEESMVSVLKRTGEAQPIGTLPQVVMPQREQFMRLLHNAEAKNDVGIPLDTFERFKAEHFLRRNEPIFIDPKVIERLLHGGFDWIDPGHFFTDATSPLDANQGALADCYFVAALASVAWARPYTIVQRNRQTDPTGLFPTPGAVDLIPFWNGSSWDYIEVTELLPMQPPYDSYVYARSDDPTESWPAIYEKAYVMWRTHDTSYYPNYAPIAYGDPVGACVAITGLQGAYYGTNGTNPHDIWQNVLAHSLSYKTFDPMVAWTYGSDKDAPTPINYANAALVANHAYSILGWDYRDGQEYIVLRNPWGYHEATLNVENGTWYAYDGSFWYPVSLPPKLSHGIFALRADTFQQYFAEYGVVVGTDTFPGSFRYPY